MKLISVEMVESPSVSWNLNLSESRSTKSPTRPFTNPSRISGSTSSCALSATGVRPYFGRRCRTNLEQVCRRPENKEYCRSYTLDYIRYLKRSNKEAESKLKETINVLSMQRSRSNLDDTGDMSVGLSGGSMFGTGILASKRSRCNLDDTGDMSMGFSGGSMFGTGILGSQRSQTFFGNIPEHLRRESIEVGNKQEVKIAKAVVPRKGLIQLTSSDEPAQSVLGVGGVKRQTRSSSTTESQPFTPKGLIRRKSMLKYIEAGQKLLEESESIKTQEEEMTKSLGEYTILDLQSKILEMTDTGSQKKRPFGMMSAPKTPLPDVKKTPARPKGNKGVTLPNINQLKIF